MAVGDVRMVAVSEIVSSWRSVDADCWHDSEDTCGWCVVGNRRSMWEYLLDEKRDDYSYDAVCESLRQRGFVRPSTFYVDDDGVPVHGDGHHRLAAAIELGITEIPYEQRSSYSDKLISADSGDWSSLDDEVAPTVDEAWGREEGQCSCWACRAA